MYLLRLLTVWMYFKTNVTVNFILELSPDTKKRSTHLAYISVDTEDYMIPSPLLSQSWSLYTSCIWGVVSLCKYLL